MGRHIGGYQVSKIFLQPGECLVEKPDSECGALNGKVLYSPPYYECKVCSHQLYTESDIEGDTDSDFQPGAKDDTDGENEDDGESDTGAPVDALLPSDTPEDAMRRGTQKKLRQIIQELNDGEGETDVYTSYFINNFDQIVDFYMLFTKYGPFQIFENLSDKKKKLLEVAAAYMMMETKIVRFKLLAEVTGVKEPNLVQASIEFIGIFKGDDYKQGAYLIEVYTPSLRLPESFVKPMQETWANIIHPRGNMRQRVVAFIGAFARESEVQGMTDTKLAAASGLTRSSLAPKTKQYQQILKKYFQQEVLSSP